MNAPPSFETLKPPRRQRGVPGVPLAPATALTACLIIALAMALAGCHDPEVTGNADEARTERAAERVALEPGAEPTESGQAPCPEPRQQPADQVCAEVVTYAQSPDGGRCCFYGTPCEAPEQWTQHADPACKAPLIDTATDIPQTPDTPTETTREL